MDERARAATAPSAPQRKPRRDDVLDVVVERFDRRGRGLARVQGCDLTLRGGLPGERWRARVARRRGKKVDAEGLELLEPSPDRVAARCAHAGTCGGCSFQELAYPAQLAELRRGVERELAAVGLADVVTVEPVLGCEPPWRYRNKMEFGFGNRRWIEPGEPDGVAADFALGLHVPGRFDKLLDLRECAIVFEEGERILRTARELVRARGLSLWDVRAHEGLLRHLVVRKGHFTGEVMVHLVTSEEAPEHVRPLAAELVARHPEITTLVQSVTARLSSVAVGERELVLHGPGAIRERLLGVDFRVSATSFFQTNSAQAQRLFELVREAAACRGDELVYDLYCGTGSIALVLAAVAGRVEGFEQVPSAVADARANAAANGIANVAFHEGDVLDALAGLVAGGARPDVVVLDPPRAGLHPKVLPRVVELAPARIVYVSCNVHAAASDLARLVREGWTLERARPIDLFPHTPHLECVFQLARAGGEERP